MDGAEVNDEDDTELECPPEDWFEPPPVCDICGAPLGEGQRWNGTFLCEYHCRKANQQESNDG